MTESFTFLFLTALEHKSKANFILKYFIIFLAGVAHLVGLSSVLEGHRFDFRSAPIPRLWVWSPVGALMEGN